MSPRIRPRVDSQRRRKLRLIFLLVILSVPATVVASAMTYKSGSAHDGVWYFSGTAAIKGGSVQTAECCDVRIETVTSFYPYYLYAYSQGIGWTSFGHAQAKQHKSRCKWWLVGGGWNTLVCKYYQ
jgi:hypothetical protein